MPNARLKGESEDAARIRYNAEMRAYRAQRKAQGRPLKEGTYDYASCREASLKRKYGITPEQAQALYDQQEGKCAICDKPVSLDNRDKPKSEHSAIDHCHKTGEVRGILCFHCNQGIGKFYDDPERLRKAAAYVDRP